MTEAIARILIPMDFSAHSERALRYATGIAKRFGAAVELVHVVEDPFASGAWTPEMHVLNISEPLGNLTADAHQRLEAMKTIPIKEGLEVRTTVVVGRPASTIVEHAKTGGFDLIVMGTHGRSGLSHALMGSVAERVVRTAPCPVTTLRETRAAVHQELSTAAMAAV